MAIGLPCDQSTLLMQCMPLVRDFAGEVEVSASTQNGSETSPISSSLVACPRMFGEYELLEEIGRGAMGVVYKARQIRLKRIVALKMLLPATLRRPGAITQLLTEAEVAAQLDHPGIIPVHDFGQHSGQPYICMAFIEGKSLAARLNRGPISVEEAVRIVADMAEAMQHAHDRGIIHRDLKPANILLNRKGQSWIGDFGLARKLSASIANSDVIAGTPSYMSPEQASGQNGRVGPASDVYSLGAILYRCLTGRAPFEGTNSLSILRQVCETEPPSLRSIDPSVPENLEKIALRSLHKDPARRYPSAAALACQLRDLDCHERAVGKRVRSPLSHGSRGVPLRQRRRAGRGAWSAFFQAGLLILLAICLENRSDKGEIPRPNSFRQWRESSVPLRKDAFLPI